MLLSADGPTFSARAFSLPWALRFLPVHSHCRGLSFSVRPENEVTQQAAYQTSAKSKIWDVCVKDALKSTYGSLDNHSLMPTHSQYDKHKRILELLTSSTCKNTFHSLRQYLECNFYLWIYFTCTSVFSSVLLARKPIQIKFILHILLVRISQNIDLRVLNLL